MGDIMFYDGLPFREVMFGGQLTGVAPQALYEVAEEAVNSFHFSGDEDLLYLMEMYLVICTCYVPSELFLGDDESIVEYLKLDKIENGQI